jgi:hypothetical protein
MVNLYMKITDGNCSHKEATLDWTWRNKELIQNFGGNLSLKAAACETCHFGKNVNLADLGSCPMVDPSISSVEYLSLLPEASFECVCVCVCFVCLCACACLCNNLLLVGSNTADL